MVVVKKGVKKSRKHLPLPEGVHEEVRLCIDYRYLNSVTLNPCVLIPRLPNLVDTIGSKKPRFFSTLDLKSGYFQQGLTEQSRPLTAFCWNHSSYQFRCTAQGLSGAPASFQRLMNKVLAPYLDDFVVCYLDDVLCFSRTFDEHVRHLTLVFEALEAAGLKLHPTKCVFARTECEFLGHTFTADGIKPSELHITAIKLTRCQLMPKSCVHLLGWSVSLKTSSPKEPN